MGGAIVLQLLDRSWTRDRVGSVVFDGPVIDWRDVLDHHARVNRVPYRHQSASVRLAGAGLVFFDGGFITSFLQRFFPLFNGLVGLTEFE